MTKYSIKYCQELAKQNNGYCLSTYINSVTDKLQWQCTKGHIWSQRLHNINRGSWCPFCSRIKAGLSRRSTIERMQQIAISRGGHCLSKFYETSATPLLWQCELEHQWTATPRSIVGSVNRKGTWCPICNGNPIITRTDLQKLAISRKGKCLSNEYKRAITKYKWVCEYGHQFVATWDSVRVGSWCPKCAGRCRSIDDIQQIAKKRGGDCLSLKFQKTTDKLWWKCGSGHSWKASVASILRGSWCPTCRNYYTEEKCRFIIESLTGERFPKTRTRVREEDLFAKYMELDGYCKLLNTAFEHHGIQHYKRVKRFHKNPRDFENQKLKDLRKIEICAKQGIHLIVIPYMISCMGDAVLIDFLKKNLQCDSNGNINFENFKIKSRLETLQEIAKRKDGKCLNDSYSGPHFRMKWECAKGHQWRATAASVKNNKTWCPVCGKIQSGKNRRKYTLKSLQSLAEEKGGKCLSSSYSTTTDRVKWECRSGHQWESIAMSVIKGSWCRKCAYAKMSSEPS